MTTNRHTFLSFLSLIRIKHWTKNLLIFTPLFFHIQINNPVLFYQAVLAFLAFCMTASMIYIINDWQDRELDAQHPVKKDIRPLASGEISGKAAFSVAAILAMVTCFVLILLSSREVAGLILLYFGMNLLYTFFLKNLVFIDLLIIVAGFIIRLYVGSFATGIPLSHWILSLLSLLAFYLVLSKRQGERMAYENKRIIARKNITRYNGKTLNILLFILSITIAIVYSLYAFSPEMTNKNSLFFLTIFFVVAGLIGADYIFLIRKKAHDPTELFWKDPVLQICTLCWIATCYFMLY